MKFISWIVVLFAFSALGQKQFSGIVKNKTSNELLSKALVQVIETGESSFTNVEGIFSFSGNFPEVVQLRVSVFGFESIVQTISTSSESKISVLLEERHLDFEEITVSSGITIQQNKNPFHIETRKLSDLNGIASVNIGEALAKIPGVYQSSLGNGISKPVIRGLQGMRVVSLLNGLRMEGQQWGGDHGMGIAEIGIGAVEVIKGPASLLYGADALGGVLYYSDEPYASTNSRSVQLQSFTQTNTMGAALRFMYKESNQKLRWMLGGSYTNHADFQLPDQKFAQNSRFSEAVIKAALGWNGKNSVHHLRYSFNHLISGIPGHTHDTIINPLDFQVENQRRQQTIPAQFFDNHYFSFENKWFRTENEWSLLIGQTLNQLTEYDEKVTIPGIQMNLWNSIYNLKWSHSFSNKLKVVNGFQGMFQNTANTAQASEALIPNAITLDNGIFSNWMMTVANWNFQAGLRYDIRLLKTLESFKGKDPISKTFGSPNAAIGAVYSKSNFTFRSNLSSGFRAPHSSELLANGFHHGALRFEIGDINLKAEKALQLDLTFELKSEHIVLIVNPYVNNISNYIYIQPKDSIIDGLPVFDYKQLNQVLFYGGDFGLHYHPHFAHNLHIESTLSFVQTQTNSDNSISLLPPARLATSLKYNFDFGKKLQLKDILVQHTFMAAQNRVAYIETVTPAYHLFNASLQFVWNLKTPLAFNIGCKNILNSTFIDHLSRLKNIQMLSPGRNFYLSIQFNINQNLKTK
jgi:iron complex outermembrane receptor protein